MPLFLSLVVCCLSLLFFVFDQGRGVFFLLTISVFECRDQELKHLLPLSFPLSWRFLSLLAPSLSPFPQCVLLVCGRSLFLQQEKETGEGDQRERLVRTTATPLLLLLVLLLRSRGQRSRPSRSPGSPPTVSAGPRSKPTPATTSSPRPPGLQRRAGTSRRRQAASVAAAESAS